MTKVRTIRASEPSRSVVHDGHLYRFRFSDSMTVADYDEWVRQVDEGDSQCRSVIVDIDGNPPAQYPDEVIDACVGELRRFFKRMFSNGLKDLGESMERSLAGLGVASKPLALAGLGVASKPLALAGLGVASKPLALAGLGVASKPLALAGLGVASRPLAHLGEGLRTEDYEPHPLITPLSPADRVVDEIRALPDRLREERRPLVQAGLRWTGDKIVPGVIVGVITFALLWAATEFFG